MSDRVSAFDRLRSLPPVFDTREAERIVGADMVTVYCHRWKKAGLVLPLGPRNVGVFFNLVVDPNGPVTRREEAVRRFLRRPSVVVGPAALHAHGWMTQRPHVLHLAVPITEAVRSLPILDHGLRFVPRSMRWFRVLAAGSEPGIESFKVADPAVALADALLAPPSRMDWRPDPEDIDMPDAGDFDRVRAALASLGASPVRIDALFAGFEKGDADGLVAHL